MKNHDFAPQLLWVSARLQLACAEHAPPIASAEWWRGEWSIFGANEQRGFLDARGEPARCWACKAIEDAAALAEASR